MSLNQCNKFYFMTFLLGLIVLTRQRCLGKDDLGTQSVYFWATVFVEQLIALPGSAYIIIFLSVVKETLLLTLELVLKLFPVQ